VYGTVVFGLLEDGETDNAIPFLGEMEKVIIEPDTIVYTIIIVRICWDKMFDQALSYYLR
jgi:hypothetical protein